MSRFCGKYDLCDYIFGYGGLYDKDGNSVTFGQSGVAVYYSDELQDFEAFKKATGGTIYQHHKLKVNDDNRDFIKQYCKEFDYTKHIAIKTLKSGNTKEVEYYTYTYWGTEYTLKEINKRGVYVEVPIRFNTILDLIPYYPYIVTTAHSSANPRKSHVIIASESYVDAEAETMLNYGCIHGDYYRAALQAHYAEVCERYILKDLDKRTRYIDFSTAEKYTEDENYFILPLPVEADYMHPVEFVWSDGKTYPHWCGPKLTEDNKAVLISNFDFIAKYTAEDGSPVSVQLKYVEKLNNLLYLG